MKLPAGQVLKILGIVYFVGKITVVYLLSMFPTEWFKKKRDAGLSAFTKLLRKAYPKRSRPLITYMDRNKAFTVTTFGILFFTPVKFLFIGMSVWLMLIVWYRTKKNRPLQS